MQFGAVIVAAGKSSRMGQFKPMLNIGSISVAQRIVDNFHQSGIEKIVMVTGHQAELLEKHLSGMGITFLRNEKYETTQMFDSAKIGLEFIKDQCDKVFFTPVDVPLFSASTIETLKESNAKLACPVFEEKKGHPVMISCALIDGILKDSGECGLKGALERCPAKMAECPVNDFGTIKDADTPKDYEILLKYYQKQLNKSEKRKIYLIRHGQPDFPEGKKMCIGKTNIPLGDLGRMQGVLLAEGMKEKNVSAVYCSHLKRSVETASYLTDVPIQRSGLQEFDCGEWDGFSFEEIKEKWPEVYELRGKDLTYPIPGAEPLEEGSMRFEKTLMDVFSESHGDVAIVGHATANKSFLCGLKGIDKNAHRTIPMDYASVTTIGFNGKFFIEKENETFVPNLTEELCGKLLNAAGTPAHVQEHCMAVKEQALSICKVLKEAGISLDEQLVITSAMLHDIARTEKDHAKKGGEWIRSLGYPRQGAIIEAHHEADNEVTKIDEQAVVAMADRCVQGTEIVPVELRFAESKKKCKTKEALEMHEKRYQHTIRLKEKIHAICGKEIIL